MGKTSGFPKITERSSKPWDEMSFFKYYLIYIKHLFLFLFIIILYY